MANIWQTKSIHQLTAESSGEEKGLKRTMGSMGLIALGIGAIIGAGLFTSTAEAMAFHSGPAVSISFLIAGLGCALAGLCYAEFASMIPIAGSAYTYAYATMGELIAWIIGWDLVLEYGLASAKVATSWSEYLNKLLNNLFDVQIPYPLSHSPFQQSADGVRGILNLPAVFIILLLSIVLIRGIKGSSLVNGIIVIVKVGIVLLFIGFGWSFINTDNYVPYIPASTGVSGEFGWEGIFAGAGVVFFAFIGFDAVSTAAQEAKNPQRDMPVGILLSLLICVVLYILFAHVLGGIANYREFQTAGQEASVTYAIDTYMPGFGWLSTLIGVAILAGFSSVILVMLMGQSRVFYSMSRDGLVPPIFSQLHPKFKTPWKSNLVFFVFASFIAAVVPASIISDMTVIGTLFAFVLVCFGILVLRKTNPSLHRPFRTPWVPVVPVLGIVVCCGLIYTLGPANWLRLIIWMAIGVLIYFGYGIRRSKFQHKTAGPVHQDHEETVR